MLRFGILDDDAGYARRLVNFFSARFASQTEPHLYLSIQALLDDPQNGRLQLLLASPELLPDPAEAPPPRPGGLPDR